MTLRRLRAMLAAALAGGCIGAHAHQFHIGITDLSFNRQTGSTEIVHTFMAHDLEALLANVYQRPFDLGEPADAALLRKYLEKQFWVQAAGQRRLPLRWVGLSANLDSIVIYQEIEDTPLSDALRIHDGVLIDFLAEQTNTLNVSENGSIRTLTFDRKTIEQGLR